MADTTFTRRNVAALGRSVFRLGLACNYGIDAPGVERALERGMDYVFWTSLRTSHLRESLRKALRERRDTISLAAGPSLGFFAGNVRRGTERLLADSPDARVRPRRPRLTLHAAGHVRAVWDAATARLSLTEARQSRHL